MRSALAMPNIETVDTGLLLRALEVYQGDRLDFAGADLVPAQPRRAASARSSPSTDRSTASQASPDESHALSPRAMTGYRTPGDRRARAKGPRAGRGSPVLGRRRRSIRRKADGRSAGAPDPRIPCVRGESATGEADGSRRRAHGMREVVGSSPTSSNTVYLGSDDRDSVVGREVGWGQLRCSGRLTCQPVILRLMPRGWCVRVVRERQDRSATPSAQHRAL